MTEMSRLTISIPAKTADRIYEMRLLPEYRRCSFAELVRILVDKALENRRRNERGVHMNLKTEIWNGCKIRFVERTPGDWWAVAVDVAKALAYAHTPHLLRRIQAEDKDVRQVDTLGGAQELVIISEDGIYDAIWGSHKAEAKVFRKWAKSIFKALRQASGLEGFQIFRTLDKAYQREEMARLNQGLHNPVQVDFIKANTIANKATASLFGFPKSIKKGDMTPEMLVARQPVLDDTVNLMVANDSFRLGLSVSEQVYDKYLHPDSQRKKTGA